MGYFCVYFGEQSLEVFQYQNFTQKQEIVLLTQLYNKHFVYFLDTRYQTPLLIRSGITRLEVTYAADEKALFQEITDIIKRYSFLISGFFQFLFR